MRHFFPKYALAASLLLAAAFPAHAEEARPLADDPAAEQRLVEISSELRCLVCQNETIAASNADLAQDLRAQIRNMIKVGKSNDDIIDYMVARYGDFVRYRPPFKGLTLLLWLGPLLFFLIGGAGLRGYLVRRNRALAADAPLNAEDERRANALIAGGSSAADFPESPS
ncbi:MAG: cytochrome c-type biogenesis protein CcmH [Zoogloeaceae bacterium]|jgi:cytochrome c-type biogenesis protein CcmH|nr:cytochrome c-type biogenesis protein CcmH [Zoogloeaceae bacterium]